MDEIPEGFQGMYSDGDAEVRCYTARVVVTRKAQKCPGNFLEDLHEVSVGTKCVVERAIVDGKWGTCYTCFPCIERFTRLSEREEQ